VNEQPSILRWVGSQNHMESKKVMDSMLKNYSLGVNSSFKVQALRLTLIVYVFYLAIFFFVDRSAELWNSHLVSASVAVAFTVISIVQILIFMRVSAFYKKTNRVIREIQELRTSNNDIHLKELSKSEENLISIEALRSDNSDAFEEILIGIEALRSELNRLNLQKLDS